LSVFHLTLWCIQPYDNGFYVATQARARIHKFLEVDDFYKSTVKPFWNSDKASCAAAARCIWQM
jgi:hypothetical protein